MRKTEILFQLGKDFADGDNKNYKRLYAHLKEETEKISIIDGNCSFDEYLQKLNTTETDYILALRSNVRGHKIFYKRNLSERKLNVYNRDILSLWEANMDLQFILNPHATIAYINSYLTKNNAAISRLLSRVYRKNRK